MKLNQRKMRRRIAELQRRFAALTNKAIAKRDLSAAAEAIGVPESTLRRLLKGHGFPSVETLDKVAMAAGVELLQGVE